MRFENDDPSHRKALIRALDSAGFNASEFNSGGGVMHVMMPLIDPYSDNGISSVENPETAKKTADYLKKCKEEASLYIATSSAASNCDIGFIGDDGYGNQVESPLWEHAGTLDDAVNIFLKLWQDRDYWLHEFLEGKLSQMSN